MLKQSLEKRIILFSFVILFVTILVNTAMDIGVFRKTYRQEIVLRSWTLATSLKSSIEKVLSLGIDIRDIPGLAEKCREMVEADPVLSYCIIISSDGKLLYASDEKFVGLRFKRQFPALALADQVADAVSGPGGEYLDTVAPLVVSDGREVGQIHVGFPQRVIEQKVYAIVFRSLALFLLIFSIAFALVVFFVRRSVIKPVSTLLESVTRISHGIFTSPVPELKIREFHELGAGINSMAGALASRDVALRNNYEELAATHTRLQDSFRQLEKMSSDLEKSEELYKRLLEEASDAIIILETSLVIIIANKKAVDFFGYPDSAIIGKHLSALLLLLKAENVPSVLGWFSGGQREDTFHEEFAFVSGQNSHVIGRIHASWILMGDTRLLQVIIRDVTKEREPIINLENSAAELSRLNRMKDSFLGLASHELKTPLTIVMGYAELLGDMGEQLPSQAMEMVQNISNASARLDTIVRDLTDVAKLDRRQLELMMEPLSLNDVISEVLRGLGFYFSVRKLQVHTSLDTSLPCIRGDKGRIVQMLSHILGNAIKFTPDGGSITVETEVQQNYPGMSPAIYDGIMSLSLGGEQLRFVQVTIRDTGVGIDPDELPRIFDRFYEVGNIEEHSSGEIYAFNSRGAGLGLAIAKGIIEIHGGVIRAESKGYDPDTCPGTTFVILFPIGVCPKAGEGESTL